MKGGGRKAERKALAEQYTEDASVRRVAREKAKRAQQEAEAVSVSALFLVLVFLCRSLSCSLSFPLLSTRLVSVIELLNSGYGWLSGEWERRELEGTIQPKKDNKDKKTRLQRWRKDKLLNEEKSHIELGAATTLSRLRRGTM